MYIVLVSNVMVVIESMTIDAQDYHDYQHNVDVMVCGQAGGF